MCQIFRLHRHWLISCKQLTYVCIQLRCMDNRGKSSSHWQERCRSKILGSYYFTDKRRPDALLLFWSFIRLSKGYCHCYRLSSSSHRLIDLPDTRHRTQRCQSVGRSVGPAFMGQQKKNTPHILRVNIGLYRPITVLSCILEARFEHTISQFYYTYF